MPNVQIGKYNRPGIYIEEYDRSVIDSPVLEGIRSLVIGVSKKGPVNTPIELRSLSDLRQVFGPLDRGLENKGSYFHRTISKLLDSRPVVALNLLKTDSSDTVDYKSFSTAAQYKNDQKRTTQYDDMFDTTGFWKRDTDSFLNVIDNDSSLNKDERLFNITNLNDNDITVFIIKTTSDDYDTPMVDWYESLDDIPKYVNQNDYVSDYMVDVVVLNGDWTDYEQLSVDPKWEQYFNSDGLVKSQFTNVVNDNELPVIEFYQNLSLLPYFRDENRRNIFIQDVINNDTDRTGLFCSYDIEKVETDYRNGLLDLIGNSLIDNNDTEEIEFLSYKDKIISNIEYAKKELDRAGNTQFFGTPDTYNSSCHERRAFYFEGYVNGLNYDPSDDFDSSYPGASASYSGGTASITADFKTSNISDPCPSGGTMSAYVIVGGTKYDLEDTSFEINPTDFSLSSNTTGHSQDFEKVFFIDTDGTIKSDPTSTQLAEGIVLGYIDITIKVDLNNQPYFDKFDYIPVSVDSTGFVPLEKPTDFTVSTANGNEITYEFVDTSGSPDVTEYKKYRRRKVFNTLYSLLTGDNADFATILIDDGSGANGVQWKQSVTDLTFEFVNTTNANKSITIKGLETDYFTTHPSSVLLDGLVVHNVDDEFLVEDKGMKTYENDYADDSTDLIGVVAQYSKFYTDYKNGTINTGDYFYENLIDGLDTIPSSSTEEPTGLDNVKIVESGGESYIITSTEVPFKNTTTFQLPEATINTGKYNIKDNVPVSTGISNVGFAPYYAYKVEEDVTEESLTDVTKIWDTNDIHYLKMYLDSDDVLYVDFTEDDLETTVETLNTTIDVISQNENFRQTLEVEVPTGYTESPNKVLVDSERYREVKVGDFLEAYVDDTNLETGEVPKKITRIISKKLYSNDSSLVELTTDSRIKLYTYGSSDKQTNRFTQVDDYITEYKGIALKGFKIRQASLPDGTEERQQEILSLVGKDTNLFEALTDKDTFRFRYLVDSFGLGLTENCKQELVDIVGQRFDALGIINFPSMKQFKNSASPSFTDEDTGALRYDYIRQGGNPEESPAFTFSLADGEGVTSAGYFTPYVMINDNGRPLEIPPAAWVATTFLRKHNQSFPNLTPWTVAAGINDGQIYNINDLEELFKGNDIKELHQMKVNPIVSKRNRGFAIETENTAQTRIKSALSFLHVREVLIELEKDLYDMLLEFQWRYNTPEVRAEIKLRADSICQRFVNQNGLYSYFNKIDSENNTQRIIQNQMGVLDTYVEPIMAMGIIVNNITILKSGTIDSGGFRLIDQ